MSFAFDMGPQGGAEFDVWLNWHASETKDGAIPGRSFSLRDTAGKEKTDCMEQGAVFDLAELKTGWNFSSGVSGVAPEWKWNDSPARFNPKPAGDQQWKKGFQIPVMIKLNGHNKVVGWSQAGAGAFNGFADLMQRVAAAPEASQGKCPVVKMTGSEHVKFNQGSTNIVKLEIVKWVDRPDEFQAESNGFDAGNDDCADTVF